MGLEEAESKKGTHSSATLARTDLPLAWLVRVTYLPQWAPPETWGVFMAMMRAESGLTLPHEPATPFCCARGNHGTG